MGNIHSCTSKGALLLVAAANGDLVTAQELLAKHPKAASYYNFKDRSSPLLQAAARGHFELVQLILETAVMTEGPERAKKNCIDHANSKRQTSLMVACKHGHPDCVEYLVTNGGDPLLTDERRHNTCLHFAALYGHSECVHKLLGSRAAYRVQGRQVPVAQIPCADDGVTLKFIDRHNGWGLSALHIAVFQGSVSTVRALLRHGADVESVICASKVENSPIRCAVGSNALHIAALTGNIIMAKLILETQESYPGLELRSRTNAAGLKPHDYAQSARNPVLMHLLDERLPVTLLRQIWMNYSLEQSLPPRTQTLGSMLQKLKLMFNLELIAIQRNVTHLQVEQEGAQQGGHPPHGPDQAAHNRQGLSPATAATAHPHQQTRQAAGVGGAMPAEAMDGVARTAAAAAAAAQPSAGTIAALTTSSHAPKHRGVEPANVRLLWARRQEEITQLLTTVSQLHDNLKQLCRRDEPAPGEGGEASGGLSRADRAATYEAVLDFILSTLITPRTVSAILHAAKKLVSASVNGTAALTAGGAPMELPPGDSDSQHGLALLSTALRAVETCLQAAVYLTSPAALEQQAAGGMAVGAGRLGLTPGGAAPSVAGEANAADPVVATGVGGLTAPPGEAAAGGGGVGADAAVGEPLPGGTPRPALGRSDGGSTGNGTQTQASAALVSEAVPEHSQGHGATAGAVQASTRSGAVGTLTSSNTIALSNAGLIFPQTGAVRGVGDGATTTPAFAAHWSAHLHTLIAQLQWDIGVQRHRRRRAHAAAAAARSAAAAAAVVAATTTTTTTPAAAGGTSTPVHVATAPSSAAPLPTTATVGPGVVPGQAAVAGGSPAQVAGPGAAAVEHSPAAPRAAAAVPSAGPVADAIGTDATAGGPGPVNLLRVLNSRRGDAVQDIVTSQSGAAQPLAQSRSDSGVSTPVAAAAAAAATASHAPAEAAALGPRGNGLSGAEGGEDGAHFASPGGIQTDEIIPLVSGVLSSGRVPAPAAGGAREAATPAAEDHLTTGGTTAPGNAPALAKRAGAKDRGAKDRDGGGAGGGGNAGDGGLDGQDDSPAASESGSDWSDDDRNVCSICMDLPVAVLVLGCQHGLCVQCAFQLCVKGRELPSCPFCRQKIGGFEAKDMAGSAAPTMAPPPAAATAAAAGTSPAVAPVASAPVS